MKVNKLERYRETMTEEVLHSWAEDALLCLDDSRELIADIKRYMDGFHRLMPGEKELIDRLESALNSLPPSK